MNAIAPDAGRVTAHHVGRPPILYFGTPVVLISTVNPDATTNLAPMSSAWWLGWRAMLGLSVVSRTTENLRRTGEAVLNLPSADLAGAVDRLALTTGRDSVPAPKAERGYRHESAKFARAGLTPQPSDLVAPSRARECPVQLEVVLAGEHVLGADTGDPARQAALEVRVVRTHLADAITADGEPDRVDPDRWRPLIMSFQHLYGLAPHRAGPSTLAGVPERQYRGPDLTRAPQTSVRGS